MDTIRIWYPSYEKHLEQIRRFWAGEGQYIISLQSTDSTTRQVYDEKRLLDQVPHNLRALAALPGVNLPSFSPDWGSVATARYWGGVARSSSSGDLIYSDPITTSIDEALKLTSHPVDDPEQDLARAIRIFRQLRTDLYSDSLWLRSPEMLGPLNTAGLVLDTQALLMALHDNGRNAHALLDKMTDFLIDYALFLRQQTNDQVCGSNWPGTFLPSDIGVAFTEDLMPLLSTRIYKEFGIPYLKKLSAALGRLHIHCCGSFGQHVRTLAESDLDIAAIEFHHPYTSILELAPLAGRTVLIPYITQNEDSPFQSYTEYYQYLLQTYGSQHRFWFACEDDSPEAQAFALQYMTG